MEEELKSMPCISKFYALLYRPQYQEVHRTSDCRNFSLNFFNILVANKIDSILPIVIVYTPVTEQLFTGHIYFYSYAYS